MSLGLFVWENLSENPFVEFITRYGPSAGEEGPVLFFVEVLGCTLEPDQVNTLDQWQQDVLRAYGRGERGISIAACHGPGKTFVAAGLSVLQSITRFPQKTVVTAPSRAQLEDALVAEVLAMYQRLPQVIQDCFIIKKNRIELAAAPEESFFSARTARAETPEALQGVHSQNVLLIADEASGVPEKIFEAAAGSMSGTHATTLLLSNPTRATGFFYDTHHKLKDHWYSVSVSAFDSSRVSDEFVRDMARRYGEQSDAYRIRVMGQFPAGDKDTIIATDTVVAAQLRDIVVPQDARTVWALDVSRYGDDTTVLLKRNRLAVLPDIQSWQKEDTMQTSGRVKAQWDAAPAHERPDEILIDVIGIGAGVVDRLRELGLPARGINVSETASFAEKYRNLRTELCFKGKEWLETKDHALPYCDSKCGRKCDVCKLADELPLLKYQFTSNGKLMAEPKDSLKKRGYNSPNHADAFFLSFASDPATLVHGSASAFNSGTNWHEPVRRNRAVV
jgi:phage terminase large subunit